MSPGLRLLFRNYEEQTGACKGLALVEESCRLQSEVINHRESRWIEKSSCFQVGCRSLDASLEYSRLEVIKDRDDVAWGLDTGDSASQPEVTTGKA